MEMLLIDPENRTITAHDVEDFDSAKELSGIKCAEKVYTFPSGDVLLVDEEGAIDGATQAGFFIRPGFGFFSGKGIIFGVTETEGGQDFADYTQAISVIEKLIRWD